MNRFVHNTKRMLECQLYDYYFLLHQNNFAYVIHLKEKLEKIVDGKKDFLIVNGFGQLLSDYLSGVQKRKWVNV